VKSYDVILAGGGIAGSAAAAILATHGLRVLILGFAMPKKTNLGETLSPEAKPLLQEMGLWTEFISSRHLPSPGNCSAWGSEDLHEQDFIFNPHGHAWRLDRAEFEKLLQNNAVKKGAQVLPCLLTRNPVCHRGTWQIEVGGFHFESSWLMDASGRGSRLARLLGVRRQAYDSLVSIHTWSTTPNEMDFDRRILIESQRDGWWYSALLPDGDRMVAFQTDGDCLPSKPDSHQAWFSERLKETRHLRELLAANKCRLAGTTQVVSAHSSKLEKVVGSGWIAVGDAAASFDPLSGQGLFNALLSAKKAVQTILHGGTADLHEYDLWWNSLWNRYLSERERFYAAENRWRDSTFWRKRYAEALKTKA
jgi:flavin-dependent dehydrogenase